MTSVSAAKLIAAAKANNLFLLKKALDADPTCINERGDDGFTALVEAVEQGNPDCIEELIKRGADVNARFNDGSTPLMLAVTKNYVSCMKLLLASPSIDINAKNDAGNTALILAAKKREQDSVKLLLASPNINVDAVNDNGDTALLIALQPVLAKPSCVKLLLAADANIDFRNPINGKTPKEAAASLLGVTNNDQEIKLLMQDAAGGIRPSREEVGLPPMTNAQILERQRSMRKPEDANKSRRGF